MIVAVEKIWDIFTREGSAQEFVAVTDCGAAGVLFKKNILPRGKFTHPSTGDVLDITAEYQKEAVEATNRFINEGNLVAFPDGHSNSVLDNLGWWKSFAIELVDGKAWVVGKVQVAGGIAKKIRDGEIRAVSPRIVSAFTDAKGNSYKNVFFHVAATPLPVIPGQEGFQEVELAIGKEKEKRKFVAGGYQEEVTMSLKAIALALKLDENADEAAILAAIRAPAAPLPPDPAIAGKTAEFAVALEKANKTILNLSTAIKGMSDRTRDQFVLDVQTRATKAGSPVDQKKLEKIAKLWDAGFEDEARELGEGFVNLAIKSAAKPVDVFALSHDQVGMPQGYDLCAENEAYAESMRSVGYIVELSADKKTITKLVPPAIFDPAMNKSQRA